MTLQAALGVPSNDEAPGSQVGGDFAFIASPYEIQFFSLPYMVRQNWPSSDLYDDLGRRRRHAIKCTTI